MVISLPVTVSTFSRRAEVVYSIAFKFQLNLYSFRTFLFVCDSLNIFAKSYKFISNL